MQLSASLEIEWDPSCEKEWFLSFLFVPDTKKHDHEHIDVPVKSIRELQKLLGNILQEVDSLPKKKKKTTKKQITYNT